MIGWTYQCNDTMYRWLNVMIQCIVGSVKTESIMTNDFVSFNVICLIFRVMLTDVVGTLVKGSNIA